MCKCIIYVYNLILQYSDADYDGTELVHVIYHHKPRRITM